MSEAYCGTNLGCANRSIHCVSRVLLLSCTVCTVKPGEEMEKG